MAKWVYNGPVLHCECGNHAFKSVDKWAVALVSAAKASVLNPHCWLTNSRSIKHRYVTTGQKTADLIHRHALQDNPKPLIDHINGNSLDNRDENLRGCTHKENMRNRRPAYNRQTSRFKGVRLTKAGTWRVEIEQNGEYLHLGNFGDEKRAARQYDRAARIFFGRFARTNASLGLL